MNLSYNPELADALEAASPETLAEIVRQAELSLQHSAETALHRDMRNLAMGMAFAAFGAAGLGAAASTLGGVPSWPLVVGAGVFGGFMMAASALSVWQARPRNYITPGNSPSMWAADVKAGASLHRSLAETAALYDAALEFNESMVDGQRAGILASWGLALAGVCSGVVAAISTAI